MENPIKMDDLGVPPFFGNTHIASLGDFCFSPTNPTCPGNLSKQLSFQNRASDWSFSTVDVAQDAQVHIESLCMESWDFPAEKITPKRSPF